MPSTMQITVPPEEGGGAETTTQFRYGQLSGAISRTL